MSQTHRLPNGGRVDRTKVLTFTFNGQQYKGYEGDTWPPHCWPMVWT